MIKKSKVQNIERSPESPTKEIVVRAEDAPFAAMTSRDYQRLRLGETDKKQVKEYIQFPDTVPSSSSILERELQSTAGSDPQDYLKAMERSAVTSHQIVWEARRKLVAKMNLPTLEHLAKNYSITPGSEYISEHPDAQDLDKGLLLARLREFLVWDGEYHGTAPEMHHIDVEKACEAAQSRPRGWRPSSTEILETVLRNASACKKANDNMLLQALKDCIALRCACPMLERCLTLRISNLDEQILELDENIKDREKQIQERDEQNKALGDVEDDEDSKDKDVLKKVKAELKKLKKRRKFRSTAHRDVCAYPEEFTPGKATPRLVRNITDNWSTAQFAKGKPVGSIVRVAWLADVFHSFWEQHQSTYLASDPNQRTMQKKASAHGKQGVAKRADTKWRSFTAQFVGYASSKDRHPNTLSPEKIKNLITGFGEHLTHHRIRGASDKRTAGNIVEYISTLAILMERNAEEGEVEMTWKRLSTGAADQRQGKVSSDSFFDEPSRRARQGNRDSAENFSSSADDSSTHADKKLRGKAGKFRKSAFSSLTLETFKACLETLQKAPQNRRKQAGARARKKT